MSVNKFICIGNIGKKPEFRVAVSGSSIANFSVAVTERFRDKEGAQKENTEWINVVAFNRLAEIVDHYMDKGTQVYVEGKLRTEKYEKDGQTKYITKIVAEKIQMLSDKINRLNSCKNLTMTFRSSTVLLRFATPFLCLSFGSNNSPRND
jgi:single-strand DNA-binding protein